MEWSSVNSVFDEASCRKLSSPRGRISRCDGAGVCRDNCPEYVCPDDCCWAPAK